MSNHLPYSETKKLEFLQVKITVFSEKHQGSFVIAGAFIRTNKEHKQQLCNM